MVARQDLENLTLEKLRDWAKRCGLPGIQKKEYQHRLMPVEYYIGLRVGPSVCLTFTRNGKMSRDYDVKLSDGIKNRTRVPDITLLYADPQFFPKIERFIKKVIRTRLENAQALAKVMEDTPIFEEETVP